MIKKSILVVGLMLASGMVHAGCETITPYGEPEIQNSIRLCRAQEAYLTSYNPTCKVPYYSAERLIRSRMSGSAERENDFDDDNSIPERFQAELRDYRGSGYDRGHMAPAADFAYSKVAMSQSFLLSNMVPQEHNANAGVWARIEMFARQEAKDRGELYVFSGPLYTRRPIKAIGNGVCVPNYTFKIIYDKVMNQSIGFIVPNSKNASDKKMNDYVVPVSEISRITGIDFSPSSPYVEEHVIGRSFVENLK